MFASDNRSARVGVPRMSCRAAGTTTAAPTRALSMTLATAPTDILLAFSPVPAAVGAARHAVHDCGLHPDVDHTVTLLTSELVGNAVRHAGSDGRIVFHARLGPEQVRVEVADHGSGFDPEIRHVAAGYGLRLVDRLASRWGVERTSGGCRVWFEVDRPRPGAAVDDA